jgi:dTMP kinase
MSGQEHNAASPEPIGRMRGLLIAFEGLDQSGKQTQAELLREHLVAQDVPCELMSFPDYSTSIGTEIARALHGERDYAADVMQLLYVANRYERRPTIEGWLKAGVAVVCDRYMASSIAYGEAQGLDPEWLADVQRFLPPADLTVLLDIDPKIAVQRKAAGRDRYERDLDLLSRVRDSYRRQAASEAWLLVDGDRPKTTVASDVIRALEIRRAQQ